jgi:hypothetical protein
MGQDFLTGKIDLPQTRAAHRGVSLAGWLNNAASLR